MAVIKNSHEEVDPLVRLAKLGAKKDSSFFQRWLTIGVILLFFGVACLSFYGKEEGETSLMRAKNKDKKVILNLTPTTDDKLDDDGVRPVVTNRKDDDGDASAEEDDDDTSEDDDDIEKAIVTDDDDKNGESLEDDDDSAGESSVDDDDKEEEDGSDNDDNGEGNDDDNDNTSTGSTPQEKEAQNDTENEWTWLETHEIIPKLHLDDYSAPVLLENFYKARENMYAKLKRDYGADTFQTMFMRDGVSVGRTALQSPNNLSRDRFKRKLVMKVLQAQVVASKQRRQLAFGFGGGSKTVNVPQDNHMVSFIWSTGGHSAAAGHGNLYNESYTAQMERTAFDVFAAVGMHLIGRNYAMGGTQCGLEIGTCLEQIFGLDLDVLSWDYGMTDGRAIGIYENYFSHAGIHPNRPAMVAINAGNSGARIDALAYFEENGMPAMYMVADGVLNSVPDTLGLSEAAIAAMPPYVQYLKCDNKIEVGEPGCGNHKFNLAHCTQRKFRTSWHPGWKWHSAYGNVMALAITDLLEDALKELVEREGYSPSDLLQQLQSEEDADYQTFFESEISKFGKTDLVSETNQEGLDMKMVLRTRPFCRTCRLPAQSRYLGLMTETPRGGMLHYEKGISIEEAIRRPNDDGGKMRLVWEAKDRQQCEVPLNQDYKDYYIVTSNDGWQTITIPNDREAEYYNTRELKGLVMITMPACDWGKCPGGDVREDGYSDGRLEMEINGVRVTSATVAALSHFVRHGDKEIYFPPNSEGRFEFRVKLNAGPKDYSRFSAFTVW